MLRPRRRGLDRRIDAAPRRWTGPPADAILGRQDAPRIFISHTKTDLEQTARLAARLHDHLATRTRMEVHFDEVDLERGRTTLYEGLLAGRRLGTAVRDARARLHAQGQPDWANLLLFGDGALTL